MVGCSVLPETQFVRSHLRVDTTRALSLGGPHSTNGDTGEMPEFDIKPSIWAPLMIFSRGYLLKSFPQGVICARQQWLKISFPSQR